MAAERAIERGTMLSTSARREASPIADSMRRSLSSPMPMWRGMNSVGFSSSPSGRADCISMGRKTLSGAFFDELGVVGLVHQLVEFGHVLDQDGEEPAFAHRVLVGQGGVLAQVLVDFGDFAGHGHVDVGGGLDRLDDARDF